MPLAHAVAPGAWAATAAVKVEAEARAEEVARVEERQRK
jgi:hypothetical protein